MPVASFVALSGRDETLFNLNVSPGHRAEPPPPAEQLTNAALCWKVSSLCSTGMRRAQVMNAPWGMVAHRQVRAVTPCAGSALPLEDERPVCSLDKSTLCDLKLAAGKATGGLARGTPRDPVPPF